MSTKTEAKPAAKVDLKKAARAARADADMTGVRLLPTHYHHGQPNKAAPMRRVKDPRIADQRLTAVIVELAGTPVGRVQMVEFPDRRGWFYEAQTIDPERPGNKPKAIGTFESRRKAVRAVLDAVADGGAKSSVSGRATKTSAKTAA